MDYQFIDNYLTQIYDRGYKNLEDGITLCTVQDSEYVLFVKLTLNSQSDSPCFVIKFKHLKDEEILYSDIMREKPPTYVAFKSTLVNIFLYERFKQKRVSE